MEYQKVKVIREVDTSRFEMAINEAIRAGYQPIGPMVTDRGHYLLLMGCPRSKPYLGPL